MLAFVVKMENAKKKKNYAKIQPLFFSVYLGRNPLGEFCIVSLFNDK